MAVFPRHSSSLYVIKVKIFPNQHIPLQPQLFPEPEHTIYENYQQDATV
jgi:hypothetical protein